jgi:hypothetical protein
MQISHSKEISPEGTAAAAPADVVIAPAAATRPTASDIKVSHQGRHPSILKKQHQLQRVGLLQACGDLDPLNKSQDSAEQRPASQERARRCPSHNLSSNSAQQSRLGTPIGAAPRDEGHKKAANAPAPLLPMAAPPLRCHHHHQLLI